VSSEKLVRQYLLGELSEEDREAVEDRLFGDADFLEEVEAAETTLMDEYVAGELPGPERKRWEGYLAAHPKSRERLALSRLLQTRGRKSRLWWLAVAAAVLALFFFMPKKDAPVVLAVALEAGALRSGTEKVQVVSVKPDVQFVRLRLGAGARATLRFVDSGRIVASSALVDGYLELEAVGLQAGDYVATVMDGQGEEIADFVFRLARLP
jgi:anti-sigma factor RsiW